MDSNFVLYYLWTVRQNLHFKNKKNINKLSTLMKIILLAKPSFNMVFDLESTCKDVCTFCRSSPIPLGQCFSFCTYVLWASVELFPLIVWKCLTVSKIKLSILCMLISARLMLTLGTNQLQNMSTKTTGSGGFTSLTISFDLFCLSSPLSPCTLETGGIYLSILHWAAGWWVPPAGHLYI